MFNILKVLSIFALLDYIIYIYYKKHYNVHINQDCYKYRIIICYMYWFILSFIVFFNIINYTKYFYVIITIISFILYFMINIYNKLNYNNYSYRFICVDTIFGIIITNILIFIIQTIK